MKIISLIASSTEIVCALGCQEQLVGRSHECDYPPGVEKLPICTEPKLNVDGTSYEIDQRVKAIVQEGISVYRVDADLLRKLKPDVIITQDQCEVCAVSLKDVEQAVCEIVSSRPKIVSLKTESLADLWRDIQKVADAVGVRECGERLVRGLKERMERLLSRVPTRPRVACIEWLDPLMAAGNWMPELVEMAGGTNLFGEAGKHSPWMTWEELVQKDPDLILCLPCGWGIEKVRSEMPVLTKRPEWKKLKAVQTGRVYLLDGNQYFNRPGPRLVESLEILAEIFHPESFNFGHKGIGWSSMRG
ncbi:MAG: cobalamin-binding protein [Deltaproteobacteria bacterium]|nr:cobalamin-binding protein [Deltaproteobacteria bacterium]MBI4373860.1 cobalamin-binding protein [Deltaproteobacteria bacterium]